MNESNYKTYYNYSNMELTNLPKELKDKNVKILDLSLNFLSYNKNYVNLPILVQKLDISSNKLYSIPNKIQNLHNLKELNVSNNLIKKITIVFPSLLKKINLSNNKLKSIEGIFNHLQYLQELNLKNNMIDKHTLLNLPITLKKLNLSGNSISEFPHFIRNLKNLEELDLSSNPIKSDDTVELDFFLSFPNLKRLYLNNCSFTYFPTSLNNHPKLEFLDFRINPMNIENIEENQYIRRGYENKFLNYILPKNLKILNLIFMKINELPRSIADCTKLKILKLDYNLFNSTSSVNSYLLLPNSLEELYLSHNMLTSIPSCFQSLNNLKIIDLSSNYISLIDLIKISKSVQQIYGNHINIEQKLLNLDLYMLSNDVSYNLLKSEAKKLYTEVLPDMSEFKNLTHFSLQHTFFNINSCSNLIRCNNLKTLNLKSSNIFEIPECFNELSSLESLNISDNLIRTLDASHLPKSLKKLYIKNNYLKSISNVYKLNNLKYLNISSNTDLKFSVDEKLPKSLTTLILKNIKLSDIPEWIVDLPNLEFLNLSKNLLSSNSHFEYLESLPKLKKVILGFNKEKEITNIIEKLPKNSNIVCTSEKNIK